MESQENVAAKEDEQTRCSSHCCAAVDELERACSRYCRWYDEGIPGVDASSMAYDMVSSIRQALAKLKESDQ